MKDPQFRMVLYKVDAKLALEVFKENYKKVPKGILKIYADLVLSNNPKEVEQLYNRLFGNITKSKNAKEKWRDL